VLVQREMESWRVPIASIAPIPPGQFAPPNAVPADGRWQRHKRQLVSKGRSGRLVPVYHRAHWAPARDRAFLAGFEPRLLLQWENQLATNKRAQPRLRISAVVTGSSTFKSTGHSR